VASVFGEKNVPDESARPGYPPKLRRSEMKQYVRIRFMISF